MGQRCPLDGNWVASVPQMCLGLTPLRSSKADLYFLSCLVFSTVFIPLWSSCREFLFRFLTLLYLSFFPPSAKRSVSPSFSEGGIKQYKWFLWHQEPNLPSTTPSAEDQDESKHASYFQRKCLLESDCWWVQFSSLRLQWNHNFLYVEESTLALLTQILQSCWVKSRGQLDNQMLM